MNSEIATQGEAARIAIAFPLRGEWRFLRPPGHHPFAFDFVQTDPQRQKYTQQSRLRAFVGPIGADQFYCWDQPVYSPVDGTVVQAGTGWPDHTRVSAWRSLKIWYNATYRFRPKQVNGRLDIRPNVGNYVMVQVKAGYIVFLAHLRQGSTLVREGDVIRAGTQVGTLGNSGNTTMPHLHINLFDQMVDPYKAKVLPFVFDEYQQLTDGGDWQTRRRSVPAVKSFVRQA